MKYIFTLILLNTFRFSHGYWKEPVEKLRLNQVRINEKTINNKKEIEKLNDKILRLEDRIKTIEKYLEDNTLNTPINSGIDIKKFKN